MADVSVNGRHLSHAGAADGGDLLRRLRSGLHRARHCRRHPADHRRVPEERLLRHRRLGRPELHQPQQRLDRHRRAAGRARHLRQLLPRPRHRRGAHDHRCLADALRHHPGRHGASGRQDRRRHGQGQAAPDAGARARGHQLLLRARRPRDARRATASATSKPWSAAPKPDQYSGDLSLYVLDAGLRLLERKAATLLYLSLSDFIQHAHAPGTPEANAFNRAVDERIAAMVAAGAIVGVVADHGMNDKSRAGGEPNVVFLQEELNAPLRRRRRARHLPDHRSVRAPSRRARLVRARLCAQGDRSRSADGGEPGAARRGGRARRPGRGAPLRAAARSGRRFRRAGRCRHGRRRHRAPSTTSQASPAIACARTAAWASRRCRSWSRTSCARTGCRRGARGACATSTSSMPCSTASNSSGG